MEFALLGSGSKGNGTLVKTPAGCILVDCGFTLKETEQRLEVLSVSAAELQAVFVTHEHGDHIKGVMPLARRYGVDVYATAGTARYQDLWQKPYFRCLQPGVSVALAGLDVTPITVPHDAREPCQFVFSAADKKLGLLTDLGSITSHVCEQYWGCQALIAECNHDETMLAHGPYPPGLKRRVGGDWGHLSNSQCADFLQRMDSSVLQHVVVAHISEQNNQPSLAEQVVTDCIGEAKLTMARQDQPLGWFSIH